MSLPLLHDDLLQGMVTVAALISFVGICFYAYSPSRKKTFDHAARLPLADDQQDSPS
jgi:cytochrome c oxidase cbb3-type subunit 4